MNRILVLLVWLFATCSSGRALDIVVTYDVARSQAPDFDPDGARLRNLVDAAVSMYEDIIEDDFTLNLAFTWGDVGSDGTLGLATTLNTDAQGRPTFSRMRFNTNDSVNWFVDPTPLDHSEFSLIQTTVGDLNSTTLESSFSGSPPSQLEVGFAGVRNSRFDEMDLLSVVIHEVGHAVGLGTQSIGSSANDGDFDVPGRFLGGSRTGILISAEEDRAHLAAPRTAMFPQIVSDVRRLPSATDILAIATAAGWQELDLPRKDFLASGPWDDSQHWIGDRVPDANDEVILRSNGDVSITTTAIADSVRVEDGTRLRVEGGLQVNELSLGDATHRFVLGEEFSGVDVAEAASLSGSLFVESTENLSVGDSFSLLSASNFIGEFDQIQVSPPANNQGLVVDVETDFLMATVAQVGDTNLDGNVNFQDFLALSRNFGGRGGWRDGNFNNDATIAFDDFLSLVDNFGVVNAGSFSASTSVPEPNVEGAFGLLCFLLLSVRRTRR